MAKWVLAFVVAVVLLLGYQEWCRPRVLPGSSISEVRGRYGEPAERLRQAEFASSAAGGFVYEVGEGRWVPARELPAFPQEAWYYPYGLLGTTCVLVYVDASGRVTAAYLGAT